MTTERQACGLGAFLPMSCRGRAEAFARRLQTRLQHLGTGATSGEQSENEESWLTSQAHYPTIHQPRHSNSSESDIYYDFDVDLESPGSGSPQEEASESDLKQILLNKSKPVELESGCVSSMTATSPGSDSSDGNYFDPEIEYPPSLSTLIEEHDLQCNGSFSDDDTTVLEMIGASNPIKENGFETTSQDKELNDALIDNNCDEEVFVCENDGYLKCNGQKLEIEIKIINDEEICVEEIYVEDYRPKGEEDIRGDSSLSQAECTPDNDVISTECKEARIETECKADIVEKEYDNGTGETECKNHTIETECKNHTIETECKNHTIETECKNHTIETECKNHTIETECKNHTIETECKKDVNETDCNTDTITSECKPLENSELKLKIQSTCNGITNTSKSEKDTFCSTFHIPNGRVIECNMGISSSSVGQVASIVEVEEPEPSPPAIPKVLTPDKDDDIDYEDRPQRVQRCSSLKTGKTPPGTPGRKKIVRFADVLGLDLADVRTFLDEIPKVPTSAYEDLVNADLSLGVSTTQQSQLAISNLPKPDKSLVPLFQQPGGCPDFLDRVRFHHVCLENAMVKDLITCAIAGTVRVLNLDFNKSVHIRYSLDAWRTFADLQATYVQNSCDGFSDTFSFVLYAHTLEVGQRLEFAIRFQCHGMQYWDSNSGINYIFQCLPPSVPAPFLSLAVPNEDRWASFY